MSVTITKSPGLDRKLQKLVRMANGRDMKKPAEDTAKILQNKSRTYPPPPQKSKYVRTMTLKNSFKTKVTRRGNGYLITSYSTGTRSNRGREYGKYVKDSDWQAGVHKGRWATREMDLHQAEGDILKVYIDFISDIVNT